MVDDLMEYGMSNGMVFMRNQSFPFLVKMYKAKMRRIQMYLEPLKNTDFKKKFTNRKMKSYGAPELPAHLRRNKK